MEEFLKKMKDAEIAKFVSIQGDFLTVETQEAQFTFELSDAQLTQCHQQLTNKKDPTFVINTTKGIIIFNTELTIEEQSKIDNIADYYMAIDNRPITKMKCEIQTIYEREGMYYAEIITENGETRIVYLSNDHFNIIQETLQAKEANDDIEEIFFSYSPELQKILLNDLDDYDEGDLELGNMF